MGGGRDATAHEGVSGLSLIFEIPHSLLLTRLRPAALSAMVISDIYRMADIYWTRSDSPERRLLEQVSQSVYDLTLLRFRNFSKKVAELHH